MATHNAPKHDFAPAWLKIPSQENPKPTGSKQLDQSSDKASRSRKEDNYRYGSDYSKLHRQNSFENYHDNNKRHPSGQTKHRHHSVDDDFYAYPYGYYNGYGYNYEKYGMQYGSQPSLFRPPNRDGKYQHTNARFGQLNGAYPNYYDLYPYDNVHGDAYFNNWYSGKGNSKKTYYEKEGRSNSKEGKDKDFDKNKEKENIKEKSLKDDDFPSLNGANDDNDSKPTKPSNSSGGVWDHPPMGKSSYSRLDDDRDGKYTSHMYKALLPNKPLIARRTNKDGLRFNGGFNGSGKSSTSNTSSFSKEASQQSPTPPIDILNTRFVTQPKHLADKKSDFLRALRKENSKQNDNNTDKKNNESNNNESKVDKHRQNCDDIYNGLDSLNVNDKSSNILSSSMEAEQRLLKEMGWKEEDDDDESYEITEDEMKEFQNLSQKVKQERNGLVRALPKAWSPKHIPLYQPNAQELNDSLSSSDSDDSC